jgi:hypothetical protein
MAANQLTFSSVPAGIRIVRRSGLIAEACRRLPSGSGCVAIVEQSTCFGACFKKSNFFRSHIFPTVYSIRDLSADSPSNTAAGFEAGLSYSLQIVLVSPNLYLLFRELKKSEESRDWTRVAKFSALSLCLYIFGLWVKHFIFAIYAVGIDFSLPVLMVGSINSILTLLLAAVGALPVFLPVIRKNVSASIEGA